MSGKMKYKISVIIPIYNVELYLEKCLFSLFNQTIGFENIEVILVDDCSTDKSKKIIGKYASLYENIKGFYLNENSGIAGKPRNVGMKHATSDYLMFLDPDDVLKKDACEILFNKIEEEQVDIVTGVHSIKNEDEEIIFPGLLLNSFTNPNDSWSKRHEDLKNTLKDELKFSSIRDMEYFLGNFGLSSKIFRKDLIEKNNILFPEYIPGEDSVFLYNALINANGFVFLNKIIYVYNNVRNDESNKSVSYQKDLKKNFGRLKAYSIMFDISKEKDMVDPYIQYLLKSKLTYFTDNFIIKNDLDEKSTLKVLKKAQPLFKEVFNSKVNILKYNDLFKFLSAKNYNSAIEYINKVKLSQNENNSNNLTVNKIPKQKDIKVAVIMDAFTYNSYKDEFIPIVLEPKDWLESFEKYQPDIFFCESVYHGIFKDKIVDGVAVEHINGPWFMKIGVNLKGKDFRDEIFKILDYCKKHNIPSIFWNKEDPTSFDSQDFNFVDTALNFDYIFTTSEECVYKYNARGHENTFPLMFASNLKLFNPINNVDRNNNLVVFAGSWYKQFEDRCRVMRDLFDKILESNLDLKIYDRVYGKNFANRIFPEKYNDYIYPSVPFNEMPQVYKESGFGLTINTVMDSYTMFARRIFELMSSNTFVISNFSKGIWDFFGNNVIYLDKINKLDLKDVDVEKITEKNLYDVLEKHNYTKRFEFILDSIDFKYRKEFKEVTCFYKLNNVDDFNNIKKHFKSITYPFKNLKLILNNKLNFNDIYNKLNDQDVDFIFEKDLLNLKNDFGGNDFFIFSDLSLSHDFIEKSLLHFQYLPHNFGIKSESQNKFIFKSISNIKNIIFNGEMFEILINHYFDENSLIEIYTI